MTYHEGIQYVHVECSELLTFLSYQHLLVPRCPDKRGLSALIFVSMCVAVRSYFSGLWWMWMKPL
jgi:hypothetical protein